MSGDSNERKRKLGGLLAYEVQVRREGVFKTISKKPLPFGKALKLGSERVTKTLAATFRLKPKGKTNEKDISFELGKGFRKPRSSSEKLTFIEKKGMRLKKGTSELPEILSIRGGKKSGKKRGKLKWF